MGLKTAADGMKRLADETAKFRAESELLTAQLEKQVGAAEAARLAIERGLSAAERFTYQMNKMGDGVQGIALSVEQAGVALKNMAEAVDQAQEKISNGNEKIKGLLEEIDKVASDSKIELYINTVTNRFKEGLIDIDEYKRQLAAVFEGLSRINAQGGGFLGDLTNQALTLEQILQRLQDEMKGGGGGESGGGAGSAPGRTSEAGVGGAAGFSGTSGSSSTGAQTGPTNSSGLTGLGANQQRGLVSSAIDLGPGGHTAAERARILRELQDQIRRLRR